MFLPWPDIGRAITLHPKSFSLDEELSFGETTVTSCPSTNSFRIRFLRKFQRYQDVLAERIILNGKARYCRAPNNKHGQHAQARPTI